MDVGVGTQSETERANSREAKNELMRRLYNPVKATRVPRQRPVPTRVLAPFTTRSGAARRRAGQFGLSGAAWVRQAYRQQTQRAAPFIARTGAIAHAGCGATAGRLLGNAGLPARVALTDGGSSPAVAELLSPAIFGHDFAWCGAWLVHPVLPSRNRRTQSVVTEEKWRTGTTSSG